MQDWSEVYELGDTYRQQQQWQSAEIAFRQAIELRPDFFWSYHHLGDVYTHLRQWQSAAKVYSVAVKLDPEFFWSWHNLADVYTKLQQWESAAEAYSVAVKLDPEFFGRGTISQMFMPNSSGGKRRSLVTSREFICNQTTLFPIKNWAMPSSSRD